MKPKPIEIAFDHDAYLNARNQVEKKKQLFVKMLNAAEEFIKVPNADINKFRNEPIKYFEREILLAYESVNVMKLSFKKLTDLLDLNVQKFFDAVAEYQKLKVDETAEVQREQFIIYATTQEQIEKFNKLNDLCTMLNNIRETICPSATLAQVQASFSGALLIDTSFTKLRPNPMFVLS